MTGAAGLGALVLEASGQEEKKKDQRKDQSKDQGKGQRKDQDQPKDQPKDQPEDQDKEQRKDQGKEQRKGQGRGRQPGRLWRVTQSGNYQVMAGDVVEVAISSNPSLGPNNPASTVRVEV